MRKSRDIAPAMYLRLTEGTDEQLDLSVSPVFRAWAGFFALLVLLVGPLALPALAEARGHKHHRHHHSKHHSLALARKSDSGGGDEHAGAISHAEDHQGVNPSNNTHNAQPGTQNSANKVGTANTNNTHNAQPGTQNSANKVGTANTNNSQNAQPGTQNSD